MIKNIIFIFAVFLILTSCKKSKVFVDTNQYFANPFLTHFENINIYTKNGQINNPSLVQNYATEFSSYFFKSTSFYNDPEFQKFILVNDDSMINVSSNISIEAKRKNMDIYDRYITNQTELVNDTNSLMLHIIKYNILNKEISSTGNIYYEIEKPVYFAKKKNDTLFFPIVKYIIISRGPFRTYLYSGKFNNIFSEEGINRLEQTDTLVVQSFDLGLKKI